ncbi:MAG TPA: CapA family protein [Verrucomicrobiota bacterium]|nr:hypothetical protein [Verrucomicrobiales bacterium]HRI12702.1 CapA family protein [Verrucomicrobiota bacterium]
MNENPRTAVRLTFVGDVALGGDFVANARPEDAPWTYPFASLEHLIPLTDLMVVNLEGPLAREGEPRSGVTAHLYNEPEVIDWFRRFPTCFCNLANNHMLDYGAPAMRSTRRQLAAAGLFFGGCGNNEADASAPVRITSRGQSIALVSYTTDAPHVGSVIAGPSSPGCASLNDPESVIASVERVASTADTVVVCLHWGHEFYHYPTPTQAQFARRLLDAGATLVVGHHPHVQQGIEEYRGGLIAYSLGNLLLPEFRTAAGRVQYRKPVTKQFAILQVEVAGRSILRWNIEGGSCSRTYRLLPYRGRTQEQFKASMHKLSAPLPSPDYPEFWAQAQNQRGIELRRESVRDALAKLWLADWSALVRTLSWHDLKRNVQRVSGLVSSYRK